MTSLPSIPGPGQRLMTLDGVECLVFGRARCPFSNFRQVDLPFSCPHCGQMFVAQTTEHIFQAMKGQACEHVHAAIQQPGPDSARSFGRNRKKMKLVSTWEQPVGQIGAQTVSGKAHVMFHLALVPKFSLEHYSAWLEATGDLVLIEDAPWDRIWGAGKDGRGTNALGRLLMAVRAQRRGEDPVIPPQTPFVPR